MDSQRQIQGRFLGDKDVAFIRQIIADHPNWSRNQIALALAEAWDWRTANGRLKNFAASSLLLKLEKRGLLLLPARRRPPPTHVIRPPEPELPGLDPESITGPLAALLPLSIEPLSTKDPGYALLARYLIRYHYLGFRRSVGENLAYLIRDRLGRDLAVALFGAPAWRLRPRDQFIGWSDETRARELNGITNNTRFLILRWVRVPSLASYILARLTRRLAGDWQAKYGHPVYLVETFVEKDRFKGVCYRAANWRLAGQTQGRGRQDRFSTFSQPVKDIYLYPLAPRFRKALCHV